jgi:hypothetical protein
MGLGTKRPAAAESRRPATVVSVWRVHSSSGNTNWYRLKTSLFTMTTPMADARLALHQATAGRYDDGIGSVGGETERGEGVERPVPVADVCIGCWRADHGETAREPFQRSTFTLLVRVIAAMEAVCITYE